MRINMTKNLALHLRIPTAHKAQIVHSCLMYRQPQTPRIAPRREAPGRSSLEAILQAPQLSNDRRKRPLCLSSKELSHLPRLLTPEERLPLW